MKSSCRLCIGIVTLMVLCLSYASAFAESLKDDEVSRRINFIQDRLDAGTINAKRWQYSWMCAYGFGAEVQLGLATTLTEKDDRDNQFDNIVGGVTNLLGVGDLAFDPLVSYNAADKLRELPANTSQEKKAKLQYAEQLLKRCADREESGRSWQTHALAGIVSLIGGVAITCDGGRGGDGAGFFAASMAVSELQIFTQPTRAISDWQSYSQMSSKDFAAGSVNFQPDRFFITATPQGIFCTYLF